MKNILKYSILAVLFLFSSQVFALSWFNITGKWETDRGEIKTKFKIVQTGDKVSVDMGGGSIMVGNITERPLTKFSISALNKIKIDNCILTSQIQFDGEKVNENTLAIKYCKFSVTNSCYPDDPAELDCGNDIWNKK